MHYGLLLLIQCNLAKYYYLANGSNLISIRKVCKTTRVVLKEEFEDTKGVIRIRKLKKDRQHNGQKWLFNKEYAANIFEPTVYFIH
jgi:hypothetical protein